MAVVTCNLGVLYYRLGDTDAALAMWERSWAMQVWATMQTSFRPKIDGALWPQDCRRHRLRHRLQHATSFATCNIGYNTGCSMQHRLQHAVLVASCSLGCIMQHRLQHAASVATLTSKSNKSFASMVEYYRLSDTDAAMQVGHLCRHLCRHSVPTCGGIMHRPHRCHTLRCVPRVPTSQHHASTS